MTSILEVGEPRIMLEICTHICWFTIHGEIFQHMRMFMIAMHVIYIHYFLTMWFFLHVHVEDWVWCLITPSSEITVFWFLHIILSSEFKLDCCIGSDVWLLHMISFQRLRWSLKETLNIKTSRFCSVISVQLI